MPALHVDRVLLVEQPDGRDMLKWALEENGFEVDLASDGESALTIAAARAPAVVIADIILPGMDGWELAHRLRCVYGRRCDWSRSQAWATQRIAPIVRRPASTCTW